MNKKTFILIEVQSLANIPFSNECSFPTPVNALRIVISCVVSSLAYKHFKGQVLGSQELDDLLTGLRSNRLLKYSYILTGTHVLLSCYCLNIRAMFFRTVHTQLLPN